MGPSPFLQGLVELGFTSRDLSFMWWCTVFATLGSIAQVLLSSWEDLSSVPSSPVEPSFVGWRLAMRNLAWVAGRVLIGALAGLVFALYLTGALSEGTSVIGRMLAFSTLLGYAAPRIWLDQARLIEKVVRKISKGG